MVIECKSFKNVSNELIQYRSFESVEMFHELQEKSNLESI